MTFGGSNIQNSQASPLADATRTIRELVLFKSSYISSLYGNLELKDNYKIKLFSGCVLEDVEIIGGDLPFNAGGGGFAADRDDDCAKECEDNPACQ